MSKILITGASGFVGTRMLHQYIKDFNHQVRGTFHNHEVSGLIHLDCTDYKEGKRIFNEFKPDVVIHLAGLSRLADFRNDPNGAIKTNVTGAENMARLCDEFGAKMVNLSTAHVFPEPREQHYDESFPLTHISIDKYGVSKARSEEAIQSKLGPKMLIIVRTDLLLAYNRGGKSHLFGQILEGTASATLDKPRQPLHVDDLTLNTNRLLDCGFSGVIHMASERPVLYTELLKNLSRIAGRDDEFSGIPKTEGILLDTTKARNLGLTMSTLESICKNIESELHTNIGEGTRRLF